MVFYISGGVALLASLLVVTGRNAVHAALYLVVSLLAVAVVFFSLGAPFVAALEIVVYAGAIMVVILFVIMLLNLGSEAEPRERRWMRPRVWIGPCLLVVVLLSQLVWILNGTSHALRSGPAVAVEDVAAGLFGPYLLGVELASMLLLAGLVGAYHLATAGRAGTEPTGEGEA